MKTHNLTGAVCAGLILAVSGAANAALVERLGGLAYYDTEADLTWLADANYAYTSGYQTQTNGAMTWADANAWAAQLDIDGIAGADGWRLPDTIQPDPNCSVQNGGDSKGYNCTGSELGNLFYNVMGGVADTSITMTHNTNYDLFSNVQSAYYWSATEYAPLTIAAWYLYMPAGYQGFGSKDNAMYAWAVQSGDISAVPVPPAVWLFGSGLLGLIGIAKRKERGR